MVILKVAVFYPEPKLFKVGEEGIKTISINDATQQINVAYLDGSKKKIAGLPYEATYVKAGKHVPEKIKEYIID